LPLTISRRGCPEPAKVPPGYDAAVRWRSLVAFWLSAIAISWAAGTLVAISSQGPALINGVRARPGAFPLPFALALTLVLVAGFGPALAAVAVSAAEAGPGGVRSLFAQILHWRTCLLWYIFALLLPTVLSLIASGLWALGPAGRPATWLRLPPTFQLLALPIGPWGEEIGWRGFAQPRLQARLPWAPASLIVGLMWFTWHQWPLLTPAGQGLDVLGLGIFFVYLLSAAILIGWVYNRGGQRLPLGWAGHAGLNLVGPSAAPFALVAAAYAVAAGLVGVVDSRNELYRLYRRLTSRQAVG
jgi:membrane protease YdiL (CAAX protease family)